MNLLLFPVSLPVLREMKLSVDQDPEGSIAEQSRLRERLLALNERLKRFGRRKAAKDDGEPES